jgi:ABC-type multidrug transport system fused ATPase/permease subunit
MKSPFKRIIFYLRHNLGYAFLNLFFNVLSAFFSMFSVVMVIPLLQLLFGQVPDVTEKPEFQWNATSVLDLIKYNLSQQMHQNGVAHALMLVCIAVVVIIFIKNVCRYLALRALAPIRNGVLRDIRNELYEKLDCALPFVLSKRKERRFDFPHHQRCKGHRNGCYQYVGSKRS